MFKSKRKRIQVASTLKRTFLEYETLKCITYIHSKQKSIKLKYVFHPNPFQIKNKLQKKIPTTLPQILRISIYLVRLMGILQFSFISQKPSHKAAHWIISAPNKKLKPTELNPQRFRNVIRKPKPTNIITWTS